tara:strand:- start:9865 stop:10962 length:1098 start_codon:yes stop_codon:yes gene_type:complete
MPTDAVMEQLQQRRKGRGASSNRDGRFETYQHVAEDDGWGVHDGPLAPLHTTLIEDHSKSIIARNNSPDVPFSQSINPFRGCEHGCIYCYARPTHTYLGYSAGFDFETKLLYKPHAAALLRETLAKPGYRCEVITLGANTDAYQPVERKLQTTRALLEVMHASRQPVAIVTKNSLVERDIDLLAEMALQGLVRVSVSLTTLDNKLGQVMEPRASAPHRRVQTIERLSAAGIPVNVSFAPVIPSINDAELEDVLTKARDAGALDGTYVLLRLPLEIEDLFKEWLETHFPLRAEHALARIRDMRGGKHYESRFGTRMRGRGLFAQLLADRFALAHKRLKFEGMPTLREDLFEPPPAAGAAQGQLALF